MTCDCDAILDEFEGWDRTFLYFSSKMAEPFCTAWSLLRYRLVAPLDPQKFENASTQTKEIATRVFIGLGAAFGAFLCAALPIPVFCGVAFVGVGSKILRAIGFALQKGGYTHVRGKASEKRLDPQDTQVKVMSWNVCALGGGLSLTHGGVVHWQSRIDAIVEKIKNEDPDVLILQEVFDTDLAEALIARLENDYAHFFIHLGANLWGSVGGGMVISKCSVQGFSHTSFANNSWTLNKGFSTIELKASLGSYQPCLRIIGTHLLHGDGPESKRGRMEQMAQIVDSVAVKKSTIPTILAGDLNIERDREDGAVLSSYLHHGHQREESTCTNQLTAQWYCKQKVEEEETIDYISLFKRNLPDGRTLPTTDTGVCLENCHLVKAFDASYNTQTALSDHHAVVLTVRRKL